ncbi:transposase [Hymenobacter terrenus]|uniref:transposase n=1 Tax=Hymenobacter terrenus TaxID=1629124 RepID=UPI0006191CCE|nr:transposase [Hymenobacter terrenus]
MHTQYRRHLPHIHPPGGALFLTMRLAGSLPQAVLDDRRTPAADLLSQRQRFASYEQQLETGAYGPTWLRQPAVMALVLAGLRQQAAQGHYELLAACAMPNHLHVVLRLPLVGHEPFYRAMQRFKSATAVLANREVGRSGRFWQDESYDHVVREGQADALARAVRYTVYNPVKAGLCQRWQDWEGTYLAEEWQELV